MLRSNLWLELMYTMTQQCLIKVHTGVETGIISTKIVTMKPETTHKTLAIMRR